MYILRVVIFSLDEPNLTQILTVFKENLVKYKGKITSREYTFILFLMIFIPKKTNHEYTNHDIMDKRTGWTIVGFLLFSLGMIALVLTLVGVELIFLNWLQSFGGLISFLVKISLVVGGVVVVALARTDWEQLEEEFEPK